jgi:hypothetical protein
MSGARRYAFLETLAAANGDFAPLLRSSLAHRHRAAGARFEERDGWLVAVAYPNERPLPVAVCDVSHVGKLELFTAEAPDDEEIVDAVRVGPAHWVAICRYAGLRPLLERLRGAPGEVVDRTSAWCALLLAGERAPDLLRRLSHVAELPGRGPLGKVPATFLVRVSGVWALFSQEYAQYGWDLALDLAIPLGGGPAGAGAIVGQDPLLRPATPAAPY